MPDLSRSEADKLLAGIVIPPRPTILTAIMEERAKDEPDLRRIAQLIANDVALSAAVLKSINSPLYGLRRQIASIDQAVAMLGLKNISALVLGLSLRGAMPAAGLDRFWDSAARTALLASHLAHALGSVSREDAHMFGLFHDCGIPLLIQRFSDYKETLAKANASRDMDFTAVEDARHQTNHAVVGSLLASNWKLPGHFRDAILHHHDTDVYQSDLPIPTLNLIATVHLAEHIENSYSRLATDAEWERMGDKVLAQLMLSADSLEELTRDCLELLDESGL